MRRNTLLPALLGWATVSGYDADPLSHFYPDICPIFSTALTPRGRRRGQVRTAVLEVVRYDHASSESIVVSGWGEREDWYRNIPAHSPLLVDTGSQRYASFHRFLTDE